MSKLCVFIKSHCKNGRQQSYDNLQRRLKKNMKGNMPELTIFPEGTLGNGETIMKLKKGAFENLLPIRVRCTRFF